LSPRTIEVSGVVEVPPDGGVVHVNLIDAGDLADVVDVIRDRRDRQAGCDRFGQIGEPASPSGHSRACRSRIRRPPPLPFDPPERSNSLMKFT